jgi:uncharacterized protein (AIM24 family)
VTKQLGAGEKLLVHAGHVGVHEPTVSFDIQMLPGFSNVIFGGEGLFMATLTGPGEVHLQSMPILNLAEEIARYLPHQASNANVPTGVAAGGAIGGILGSILSGNN